MASELQILIPVFAWTPVSSTQITWTQMVGPFDYRYQDESIIKMLSILILPECVCLVIAEYPPVHQIKKIIYIKLQTKAVHINPTLKKNIYVKI